MLTGEGRDLEQFRNKTGGPKSWGKYTNGAQNHINRSYTWGVKPGKKHEDELKITTSTYKQKKRNTGKILFVLSKGGSKWGGNMVMDKTTQWVG